MGEVISKEVINVSFATDENYVKYMATAILSILINSQGNDLFHFYILCNDVSEKSKKYIEDLKRFKEFQITFFDMDINDYKDFPAGGEHITNTTYYRYKIAELCSDIDKIIYLDCDTLVCESLRPLFDADITDFYIGGVEDIRYTYWRDFYPNQLTIRGFYVNAGVLLINLKKWRQDKLFEKMMRYTTEHYAEIKIGDQHVINTICKDKILPLSYRYNVQDCFFEEKHINYNSHWMEITEATVLPGILHYTTGTKPWKDFKINRANDWLNVYLLLTKDEPDDPLRKQIEDFQRENN